MTDNRLPCALQWTFPLFLLYIQADGLISEAHTCPADVDAAWSSMRSIPLQAISTRRQELALMPSAPLLEQGHFVRDYVLVELVTVLGTHGRWEESECFAPGFRSTLGAGPARQQLQHFPPLQLSAPEQVSRDSTTDLARVAKVHASTNDVIGTQSTTSAVPISDRYELGQRFARGSHGEVWRAERRRQHAGQDSAGTSAGVSGSQTPGTSSTSGDQRPQERESYVMKRMLLKTSLAVAQCGRREVYFGQKLRGQRRVARFVEHFFVWHDETNAEDSSNDDDRDHDQHSRRETANADELWLVFRDEGLSLRHHLYTLQRSVGSVLYVPSKFWHEMRHSSRNSAGEGAVLMRELLRQLVEAVHELHAAGVTHRDLKPSNLIVGRGTELRLTIADFGSAVDDTSIESMYGVTGPSRDEASLEYAPPEVLLEPEPERSATKPTATPTVQSPIPYYAPRPSSYDMWSIGVIWLEMILGTTQIFEPEPRARVILEQHLSRARASDAARRNFMLLAAMADFCIWTDGHRDAWRQSFWKRWPKKQHQSRNDVVLTRSKEREPLQHLALAAAPSVQAPACDVHEFNRTLRRRDPLDIGLPDRWALDLLWRLLRFDPTERISAQEALDHAYLRTEGAHRALDGTEHATQAERAAHDAMMRAHKLQHRRRRSQNYTLREANATEVVPPIMMKDDGLHKMLSFCCPKCGRCFADWESCHAHVRGRRHAHFCDYNATNLLPLCMSAHALMMHDPHSGWCDLQGRRPYMEDFHSLYYSRAGFTMYGVFDGHSGTRAAKFAASSGAGSLFRSIEASIGQEIALSAEFKDNSSRCAWSLSDAAMEQALVRAFNHTQHAFVQQLQQQRLLGSSGDNSGSTATVALLFPKCDDSTRMARLVVANVGDSRAVLCCGSDFAARSSQHVVMSVDHSPALQIERERIESGGGFVSGIGQGGQGNRRSARSIARLMGQLAVSRSIGDIQLDAHLSRRPTVRERKIQQHDRFLIVATDGLWDVVGSDEAVEMVLETIGPRRSVTSRTSVPDETRFQRAALRLSREAFVRGSSDNIGVFVLDLETRA